MRTKLQGGIVVGYDGRRHVLIRHGVVVWEDDRIVFVGKAYPQAVDRTLSAPDRLIIPGLIDLHWHAGIRANWRLTSDHGDPQFFGAGFPNTDAGRYGASYPVSEAEADTGATLNVLELLSGGCTTLVEVGASALLVKHLVQQVERFGVRAYLGPGYRSANYYRDADGVIQYDWDEAAGQRGLEAACQFIREHDGRANGRIRGMLFPLQADTCTRELLQATAKASEQLGVPVQIHTGQNLMEFHQTLRRYRRTPVELLDDAGLLGPRTTLGHCIMVSGHPQAHYPDGRDLDRIAAAKANVAHCPVSLGRRGMHLHHLSGYLARGINVGLGTDIHPFDLIREMRDAGLICKVAAESPNRGTAREVFNAATIGGATALGRDDLGRLAPGAKADLAIVNQQALHYGVIVDPIRSLVDCGVASDVETVIVDGQIVMENRQIPGAPAINALLARAQQFAEAYWSAYAQLDWHGRPADDAFPNAFPWAE
ncbi:MAG TPA: chlorohydrolase family protein [Alphaproteobacteria bacterium]|nr:chlorohydrolase family protein [Alphaproteobacteria bacterium]